MTEVIYLDSFDPSFVEPFTMAELVVVSALVSMVTLFIYHLFVGRKHADEIERLNEKVSCNNDVLRSIRQDSLYETTNIINEMVSSSENRCASPEKLTRDFYRYISLSQEEKNRIVTDIDLSYAPKIEDAEEKTVSMIRNAREYNESNKTPLSKD